MRQTHETAGDLERRLKVTKAEVKKYKAKAEQLEKNRRLGYLPDKGSEADDMSVGGASGMSRGGTSLQRRGATGKAARK